MIILLILFTNIDKGIACKVMLVVVPSERHFNLPAHPTGSYKLPHTRLTASSASSALTLNGIFFDPEYAVDGKWDRKFRKDFWTGIGEAAETYGFLQVRVQKST